MDLTVITDAAFATIWRARTGDRLRCRGCQAPVHAKRIESTGLRFFAHSRVEPTCPSQGESARYLGLKGHFAAAFRKSGGQADLEVASDDWRADVLVCGPQGQRVAVEVQLAALTFDAALDRMRRHHAAGVATLWVLCDKRLRWATQFSTVLLDANDFVVNTVMQYKAQLCVRPTVASAATVDWFAARWAEGRLTPVQDSEDLQFEFFGNPNDTQYFQLDCCVGTYVARVRSENELELERIERTAAERRQATALAKQARLPVENVMAASLSAFQGWFCAQTRWKC